MKGNFGEMEGYEKARGKHAIFAMFPSLEAINRQTLVVID